MKIWLRINKKQVDKVFFPWLKRYQKIPTNEIVWVNKWFGESHYRFKDLNPWHKKALKSFSALAQKALYFIGIAVHNYYLDQCCKYGNCCNQIIINNPLKLSMEVNLILGKRTKQELGLQDGMTDSNTKMTLGTMS